jgi:hypothetical protein
MKLATLFSTAVAVNFSILPALASYWSRSDAMSLAESISASTNPIPKKFGFLAFPRFVGLDAFGPLELFWVVAFNTPNMTLSIIAETMDFVPDHMSNPISGPLAWLKPTYTIDDDPDIDVLFVPGMFVYHLSLAPLSRNHFNLMHFMESYIDNFTCAQVDLEVESLIITPR